MKYQFVTVYLYVLTICLNELDSVCLNGRAGQGKHSPRYTLKYVFVYLKVRILLLISLFEPESGYIQII